MLCEQLDEITSHIFIARSQYQYLSKLKENLKCGEVIILGNFAENFSFIVQDEIQDITGAINNVVCILLFCIIVKKMNLT